MPFLLMHNVLFHVQQKTYIVWKSPEYVIKQCDKDRQMPGTAMSIIQLTSHPVIVRFRSSREIDVSDISIILCYM